MIPTPEQEAATLAYFKEVLTKYESETEERIHVANCIKLMINTIEESIKERNTQIWKKIESTPSLENHKEELEEVKGIDIADGIKTTASGYKDNKTGEIVITDIKQEEGYFERSRDEVENA